MNAATQSQESGVKPAFGFHQKSLLSAFSGSYNCAFGDSRDLGDTVEYSLANECENAKRGFDIALRANMVSK